MSRTVTLLVQSMRAQHACLRKDILPLCGWVYMYTRLRGEECKRVQGGCARRVNLALSVGNKKYMYCINVHVGGGLRVVGGG